MSCKVMSSQSRLVLVSQLTRQTCHIRTPHFTTTQWRSSHCVSLGSHCIFFAGFIFRISHFPKPHCLGHPTYPYTTVHKERRGFIFYTPAIHPHTLVWLDDPPPPIRRCTATEQVQEQVPGQVQGQAQVERHRYSNSSSSSSSSSESASEIVPLPSSTPPPLADTPHSTFVSGSPPPMFIQKMTKTPALVA